MKSKFIAAFTALVLLSSCSREQTANPKPRMYPRIFYPAKAYHRLDTALCAFTFNTPDYSRFARDSFRAEGDPQHPCWFDLKFDSLNASLYCSYYSLGSGKSLTDLVNDAFTIAGKHNIKANYRKETLIENSHGAKGILFEIEGPVASPLQFYLTDGKKHFFRGSFYFDSKVNPDSTAPVLHYFRPDIDTLIASFRWKN